MRKYSDIIFLFIVTSLVTYLIFKPIIDSPNSSLFSSASDGLKNYFTPYYYIEYGSGTQFKGMNYPYGDHIIYPDTQPILVWTIKFISEHIIDISDKTIGILNLCMVLSLIPGVLILYLILRECKISKSFSFFGALSIGFLSPQIGRMVGHYGMVYIFCIPLLWYILLRLFQGKKVIFYGILYTITVIIFSLLHMYFLSIGFLLGLGYWAIYLIQNNKNFKAEILPTTLRFIFILFPIIFFKVFFHITDPIKDRFKSPWGMHVAQASFDSVFYPVFQPLNSFFSFFLKLNQVWEGFSYVGITGLVVLIFSAIKYARYSYNRNFKKLIQPVIPSPLKTSLWVGIGFFFFSTGFVIDFFPQLLNIIPELRQFRSLGRFAWVFYFIFSVYTVHYLYLIYRITNRKWKPAAITFFVLAFTIYLAEAYINVKTTADYISQNNLGHGVNLKNTGYTEILDSIGYKQEDFQAIVPIPYLLIGTDKFAIEAFGVSNIESTKASLTTSLPLTSTYFARSSYDQARKLTQFFSNDYISKEVLNDFPNRKPLLILCSNEPKTENELNILKKGKFLYKNNWIEFYKLDLDSLLPKYDLPNHLFSTRKNLNIISDSIYTNAKPELIYHSSFKNSDSKDIFLYEPGSAQLNEGELELFNEKIKADSAGQIFDVSFWVYAKTDTFFPEAFYHQFDIESQVVESGYVNPKEINDVYKDWVNVTFKIKLQDLNNRIKIHLKGYSIMADELLIKPENSIIIKDLNRDQFLFNNFIIPKNQLKAP